MGLMDMIKVDGAAATPAVRGEAIEGVIDSGNRMLEMIDEILSLSRLKSGKIIPSPAVFSAFEMAKSALAVHQPAARRKGITLVNDIEPAKTVFTDPDLMAQVLRNAVSNAVKFCRSGDTVRISMPPGATPVIEVADTGPGIKENVLLDLFRQDKNVTTPGAAGERGTGLGLPFSKDIMEALGGALSLKTSPKGTRIFLYLPLRKPKILLVDDDKASLDICRKRLSELDVEILQTSDGAEAIKMMDGSPIDLVVSDIMMPGVDGFEILKSARNKGRTSSIPVILISGETGAEVREKAISLGVSDFLSKLSPPRDLVDLVRRRIYR